MLYQLMKVYASMERQVTYLLKCNVKDQAVKQNTQGNSYFCLCVFKHLHNKIVLNVDDKVRDDFNFQISISTIVRQKIKTTF